MRPELQQIDRIVRYQNNDMMIQEKAEFEMYLSEHPEIKGEIENILLLEKAVVRNAIKTDIIKYAPKNTARFSKWIAIFSALILLVGLIYFVKSNSSDVLSGSDSEVITSLDENSIPTADSVIQTIQTNDTIVRNNQTKSPDQSASSNFRSGNSNVPNQVKFWIEPDVQRFEIDPIVGKAIECNNGTLIVVPARAFVDETGQIIQMPVQLEVIEATKLSEMIAYNLTTTANGKPLSSGGMLYIQPFVDGKKVWINPQRPLYIEIPTDDYNPNMQSWRGVVDDKGDIAWEKPRNLEKFLVRVDFELLDFLPPGFEDAVYAGMPFRGHSNATKELVDSLYYALIGYKYEIENIFDGGNNLGGHRMIPPISDRPAKRKTKNRIKRKKQKSEKEVQFEKKGDMIPRPKSESKSGFCFLNPVTIFTIQSNAFSNTFIATHEFESRLRVLHGIPDADPLLDLYIKNLGKNLWEVDMMVAQKLYGSNKRVFEDFAAQRCTNLQNVEIYQELLSEYYNQKMEGFQRENQKLRDEYLKKNQQDLQSIRNEIDDYKMKITQIEIESQTLKSRMDVYPNRPANPSNGGSLRMPRGIPNQPRKSNVVNSQNVYATTWFEPGWMNIDVYLKSIDKNSVDVEILVNNPNKNIEHIKIYQCISSLQTLIPLRLDFSKALARFPSRNHPDSRLAESSFVIGIQWDKDGRLLMTDRSFNPYKTNSFDLTWVVVSSDELKQRLFVLDYSKELIQHVKKQEKIISKVQALREETAIVQNKMAEAQSRYEDLMMTFSMEYEFMNLLAQKISVCDKNSATVEKPELVYDDEKVDTQPAFATGEMAMSVFISENFKCPHELEKSISGTIYVSVVILADGRVTDAAIRRGLHPLLDVEALRVVNAFPNFSPAILNGAAVNCRMIIPIKIRTD